MERAKWLLAAKALHVRANGLGRFDMAYRIGCLLVATNTPKAAMEAQPLNRLRRVTTSRPSSRVASNRRPCTLTWPGIHLWCCCCRGLRGNSLGHESNTSQQLSLVKSGKSFAASKTWPQQGDSQPRIFHRFFGSNDPKSHEECGLRYGWVSRAVLVS
jgi:hypothetical protein